MEYPRAYQIIPCLWIANRSIGNSYSFNKEANLFL